MCKDKTHDEIKKIVMIELHYWFDLHDLKIQKLITVN